MSGSQRRQIHRDRKWMVGPGAGGEGVSVSWGQSVSLGRWESSGDGRRWWLHNSVNVLAATELCTYKWPK